MKTKVSTKAKSTEETKVKAPVKVPANIKAAVDACFKADSQVASVVKSQEKTWLNLGTLLAKAFPADSMKEADDARDVLKQAFTDADKDPKEIQWASYISKILALGYPAQPEQLKMAADENLSTNKLLAVARGSLKKKGKEWVKVEKKGGSGGSNRLAPFAQFEKSLVLAFTGADTAKLKLEAIANAIRTATKDTKYDLAELGKLLQETVED